MTPLESSGARYKDHHNYHHRLACCFVILMMALVLFAAQGNHPFIHTNSESSALSQIYLRAAASSSSSGSSSFLKQPSSTEDSQRTTPVAALHDSWRRVDLQSNQSYALMTNDETERQWLIQKRALPEYETEINDLADRVYRAKNESSQLDVLSGIGLPAMLEMEDGRGFTCLQHFYDKWRSASPFSGEPFFDWLDYGSGRHTDTKLCSWKHLNRRRYGMLNETEIEASRVEFRVAVRRRANHHNHSHHHHHRYQHSSPRSGKVVQAVFVASQQPVEEGLWLSVWDLDQKLHLIRGGRFPADGQPFGYFKRGHGSVTRGQPVLYAGEMGIGKIPGLVQFTNPESGHYRPKPQHTRAFYLWMRSKLGDVAKTSIDWRPCSYASNSTLKTWKTLFE